MAAVAWAVTIIGSMGGCARNSSEVSFNDVVGNWEAPTGASISLHPDGTFEAAKIPGGSDPTDRVSGSGTWSVREGKKYHGPGADLAFDLGPGSGKRGLDIYSHRVDGELRLCVWIGDPDLGDPFEFVRKDDGLSMSGLGALGVIGRGPALVATEGSLY